MLGVGLGAEWRTGGGLLRAGDTLLTLLRRLLLTKAEAEEEEEEVVTVVVAVERLDEEGGAGVEVEVDCMEGRREEEEEGSAGMVPGSCVAPDRWVGEDEDELEGSVEEWEEARETGGIAGSRRGAADRADATDRGR